MSRSAILILEEGSVFRGRALGYEGHCVGEVVFNTSMTGYQEILSDPSYAQQIITLTCPHIGNVGINQDDNESNRCFAAGLVIRDLPLLVSSWRSEQDLESYLIEHKITAICEVDTRRLTRLLRDKGAKRGCISHVHDESGALNLAREFSGLQNADCASEVTTEDIYQWETPTLGSVPAKPEFHVVVYDFGVKQNILRLLVDRGCRVTVVPATTPAADVIALGADGIMLSNGPGDPAACDYAIASIKEILGHSKPILAICLGFQLLALAMGAKTYKMKLGHHGANHPIIDVSTGKVFITSQNHGFAVDAESLPKTLEVTHKSLFDGTVQGIRAHNQPIVAMQGHPEASPGPEEMHILFDDFIAMMQ